MIPFSSQVSIERESHTHLTKFWLLKFVNAEPDVVRTVSVSRVDVGFVASVGSERRMCENTFPGLGGI